MKKTGKKIVTMLLVAMMIVAGLVGCNKNTTTPATSPATTAESTPTVEPSKEENVGATESTTGMTYAEAPMLSDLSSAGTIPAVEERMPVVEDVMIENVDSIGTYGGSFQFAFTKAGWNTGKPIEQGLFRFRADGTVEPNVAKGYEVNDDATVYTIYLREGMKWSDGVAFTAADCVFFYDKMCVPGTFGKSLYDCFKVDHPETGEETTAKFDQIDDYTFTVTFEYPKASFIENLTINAKWCFAPKHYQETILPEFVGEEKANEIAIQMGFSDAAAMGKETGYYYWNVSGVPTLNPYVLSTEAGKNDVNGDYYEFVRNPYFWKVDQEGNQLPYIDQMEITKIAEDSQNLLKLLAGETTINAGISWSDVETVQENAESVGYDLLQWENTMWADGASQLQLNQTATDDDLRNLFQSIEFRQALSVAVDRDEYSKLISDGWSEGKQASPAEGTLGANAEWTKKWTEYNPDSAKKLLEGLGLVLGSDGYYDFGTGKDLVLDITSFTDSGADNTYVVLKKYYDEIGIKTTYQPVDKDLLNNRLTSNDYDVILGPVAPAETFSIILRPDTLVPVRNYAAWYGQVGNWYASNGAEGYQPEGDLLELCNLYDQLKGTIDLEKQKDVALKLLKLHEDNVWVIGYMGAPTTLMAVDRSLKNFEESAIFCDEFRGIGLAHIEGCYFAK